MPVDHPGDQPADQPADAPRPAVPRLSAPRDGVPPLTDERSGYEGVLAALAAGTGPVAVDAERASGHRYGQRAFLVQVRRAGAGTVLIDPVALPDLSELNDALTGVEWILHAASQDLPCLAELGLRPTRLFDTELGGRLAGMPRVGLAAMVESLLGLALAKEHSAVDWSTRPLPEPWLRYAALDVEVLVELHDQVAAELARQGKLDWAREEFAAVAAAAPPSLRADPWRRTSGMHRVRDRRRLAMVRQLWAERDRIAQQRDISPGRILPDAAIVDAAVAQPTTHAELVALPSFAGRGARRHSQEWFAAVQAARELPEADLPPHTMAGDGPPPPRAWPERDPAAAARLAAARAVLADLAAAHTLPVENLVSPDLVRRLCWSPPHVPDGSEAPVPAAELTATVAQALRSGGAREWQITLVAAPLAAALAVDPTDPTDPADPADPVDPVDPADPVEPAGV